MSSNFSESPFLRLCDLDFFLDRLRRLSLPPLLSFFSDLDLEALRLFLRLLLRRLLLDLFRTGPLDSDLEVEDDLALEDCTFDRFSVESLNESPAKISSSNEDDDFLYFLNLFFFFFSHETPDDGNLSSSGKRGEFTAVEQDEQSIPLGSNRVYPHIRDPGDDIGSYSLQ